MLSKNEGRLLVSLTKLHTVIARLETQVARMHEIERTDLLIILKLLEEPTNIQTLAKAANISSGAITYAINSLSKRNIVEKKRRATDNRKFTVSFTHVGRLKAESVKTDYNSSMKQMLRPINELDMAVLSNTIEDIYIDIK